MKDTSILTNNGINVQASLELFGDMEMYDETLGDFLDMSDEKITTLEQYKNANDMPNYAIAVHALKSDARYLGFTTLADLSYESEMKSKAGDSVFVAENHSKILQEAKRVINLSQQYMGRELTQVIPDGASAQPAAIVEAAPVQTEMIAQPVAAPVQIEVVAQPAEVAPITIQSVDAVPVQTAVVAQPVEASPITVQSAEAVPVQTAAVAQPVVENSVSNANTIQFFPADNYGYDPMSQALYMQQQTQENISQVAAVKKGIILVVDDSPLVSNFVKKIFSSNYDVMIASDGQKAIDIINDDNIRSQIKTCLLDLNMPNVNGFDVMDYFKEKGFFVRTPVAIISGAEDDESLDKAKGYPIVDVLPKPFNERDVQRVVEKCLAVYF
ncbi:MAG: response regulator [Bacilli bacterium]|nr:response regulator [Bacilli bacterium]